MFGAGPINEYQALLTINRVVKVLRKLQNLIFTRLDCLFLSKDSKRQIMIVVTGAAGFIGSCMVGKLNNKGFKNIILVDDFMRPEKYPNIAGKIYLEKVERMQFFSWLDRHAKEVDFIFHIGARTDTTEFDMAIFDELNLNYSKKLWNACTMYGIPLIYASSAATYGDGNLGYDDHDPDLPFQLQPLNPYGISKNDFDKWALQQTACPPPVVWPEIFQCVRPQ